MADRGARTLARDVVGGAPRAVEGPASRPSSGADVHASGRRLPAPLSPGKLRGLQRVADEAGKIRILAIDQNHPFEEGLGLGEADASAGIAIRAAKLEVVSALAPYASAVVLDVDHSARAALTDGVVPRNTGLGVRLEKGVPPGDAGREEPGWDVERIRRLGADAVKLLVYMDVDDTRFSEAQLDFVRRTADACEVHDLALITEGLTFPRPGEDEQSARFRERRVANILGCAELLGPWTDVLKLEFPGEPELERLDARAARPWVLLSAGVDFDVYERQVEAALGAGASGFMAGRAIVKELFDATDADARRAFLEGTARRRMGRLAALTERLGASVFTRGRMAPDAARAPGSSRALPRC